jgi:hypothetical protein
VLLSFEEFYHYCQLLIKAILSIYLRIGELYTINVVKIYLPLKIIKKENFSALPLTFSSPHLPFSLHLQEEIPANWKWWEEKFTCVAGA